MGGFVKNKILGLFVKTGGVLSAPLTGGKGFIICLHRVLPLQQHRPFSGKNGMAVSPEYLDWLITTIRSYGFTIISMDEIADGLKHGSLKNKIAAITLDDGFADNLQYGYPVFKKHNCPFTIYVANSMPNGTLKLWAEGIEDLVMQQDEVSIEYNNGRLNFNCRTAAQKIDTYNAIRFFILDAHNLADFNSRIAAALGSAWLYNPAYQHTAGFALSWNEVEQLANEPLCTIGAHTMNHLPLAKLSEQDSFQEMLLSKQELESRTGKTVRHFAYPYGKKNECGFREFALAEKAGFSTAVTGLPGNISLAYKKAMYNISRYPIGEATRNERLQYISNGILHYSFNGFKKVITE